MKKQKLNDYNIKTLTQTEAKRIMPMDFADLQLNLREYKYIAVYCTNGFKGGEACAAAGYKGSKDTLRGLSWALQKRPHVMEAVKRFIDSVITPYKAKLEYEILHMYYQRAFYDISVFYDDDGRIRPLDEVDVEWRCCVDGVEERYFGKDANRRVITYQLANRDTALQTLYKMVSGFDGDTAGGMLPSEARERLQKIFSQGKPGNGDIFSETKMTRTTLTIDQVTTKTGKPGRPRKHPIIDITPD